MFFQRSSRVTTSRQYSFLFARAKRFHCRGFSFFVMANNSVAARLGVVVGKKKQKKAVARNKTKRTVRESFRISQHQLQGLDIVVVARPGSGSILAQDLRLELNNMWDRLRKC